MWLLPQERSMYRLRATSMHQCSPLCPEALMALHALGLFPQSDLQAWANVGYPSSFPYMFAQFCSATWPIRQPCKRSAKLKNWHCLAATSHSARCATSVKSVCNTHKKGAWRAPVSIGYRIDSLYSACRLPSECPWGNMGKLGSCLLAESL